MRRFTLYTILFILGFLRTGISTVGSDEVVESDNATVVTKDSENNLVESFIEKEGEGAGLFASPGPSLSLVPQLWESVKVSQYQVKLQFVVTNFSKWLMTHVFSKMIKGQLSQLPNFIGPGLKEYALAWQDEFWSSSEGLLTWAINGTSLMYCMVYWRVEDSDWHRRCPNRIGIGCFSSAAQALIVSSKIVEESKGEAKNSAVTDNLDWTYSHSDSISIFHCAEEFCIQGLFPPGVQSIIRISLLPLYAEDWKASDKIDQQDIELLKNSTHTEIDQQLVCDTNYRVVKIVLLTCALLMVKIIVLVCFLSRRMCPG